MFGRAGPPSWAAFPAGCRAVRRANTRSKGAAAPFRRPCGGALLTASPCRRKRRVAGSDPAGSPWSQIEVAGPRDESSASYDLTLWLADWADPNPKPAGASPSTWAAGRSEADSSSSGHPTASRSPGGCTRTSGSRTLVHRRDLPHRRRARKPSSTSPTATCPSGTGAAEGRLGYVPGQA